MMVKNLSVLMLFLVCARTGEAQYPTPTEGDFILRNFRFNSGEVLPELRVWRRIVIDAIRTDPEWNGGNYSAQPQSLRTAQQMLYLMSSNPVLRQRDMPTLAASDSVLDAAIVESLETTDANDVLYQVEASGDYDPGLHLERIRAPLIAVNSEDDLINPPELQILEREITNWQQLLSTTTRP